MAHLHVKTPNGTLYSIDLDAVSQIGSVGSDNNGWGVLTNGAILQWGQMETVAGDHTFPIEFPSMCLGIFRGGVSTSDASANHRDITVKSLTNTGFYCYRGYQYWIAIGY